MANFRYDLNSDACVMRIAKALKEREGRREFSPPRWEDAIKAMLAENISNPRHRMSDLVKRLADLEEGWLAQAIGASCASKMSDMLDTRDALCGALRQLGMACESDIKPECMKHDD